MPPEVKADHATGSLTADLMNCDREPIRTPGSIQPHGALLLLDGRDFTVRQASVNVGELLGVEVERLLGQPIAEVFPGEAANLARDFAELAVQTRPALLATLSPKAAPQRRFLAIVHRISAGIVLELEAVVDESRTPTADIHSRVDSFTLQAEEIEDMFELSQATAKAVRMLTGFDRVLVYRFDQGWNGIVVGEDGNGALPALLHHRFPASDIPAQARELYRVNRVRIIPDVNYQSVPIRSLHDESPQSAPEPLDLTFAVLRSVSPIHVEYMKNMETASSMSVSILQGGKLWGLISCHHRKPRFVSFPVRGTCDLFARAFSLRLAALEREQVLERRIEIRSTYSHLLSAMAERGDFAAALTENPDALLAIAAAQGAAIVTEDACRLIGKTPNEHEVRQLAAWLHETATDDLFSTDGLSSLFAPAEKYLDIASGLLAIGVSKLHPSFVLWFRPEVLQTIKWGGDPRKPVELNGGPARLHPRRSFETWKETVSRKSIPWNEAELEGAAELRNAIVSVVLRKAEEFAELNAELTRSNRELEAFSYSVSHDLRAPLRHIVGYAEMLREMGEEKLSPREVRCINTIIESSEYAGRLVEKLLEYSRLGRAELQRIKIDMNALASELRDDVMRDATGRNIEWRLHDLPKVEADLMMLRMALRDLMANAVKYTRKEEQAVIDVGCETVGGEFVFHVQDNGVGFSMAYADKLFGVFQRLHRWEDYEGTGIGLANVRRVIERHGGRAWATGEEGVGATFYFSLPR